MSDIQSPLTNYAANGYNAKDGDFLGAPVFTLTYTGGHTVPYGTNSIPIPDGFSVQASQTSYSGSQTMLMETQADYDRSYSASVDAEYTGVSFSGSISSSLLYHGDLFTSQSTTYGLNQYVSTVLEFERTNFDPSDLDPTFVAALKALPQSTDADGAQMQYFEFFDEYGTHYVEKGTLGGTIVMETDIANNVMESYSALEISTAVSAGYNGVINSGKIDASFAYAASDLLKSNSSQIQISTTTLGGLYAPDTTISAWQASIYATPRLLFNVPGLGVGQPLSTLYCISNLAAAVGEPVIATNIEAMLHAYITPLYTSDGMLTSPSAVDLNVVTPVDEGDGFLLATLIESSDGDRAWIQGLDDANGNPTTVRACASQHFYTPPDRFVPSASFLMPAPNGLTYTAESTTTSGQPAVSLQFIGLTNATDAAMQPWQPVTLGTSTTAPQDGFVVAYVDWNNQDGSRGYVQGTHTMNGQPTTVAGASQHRYGVGNVFVPCNSFTMPVRQNVDYSVTFTTTNPTPVAQAYFVPLNPSVMKFGDFGIRQPSRIYQALTDGFLVAYLATQSNTDRGYVNLYSSPDQNAASEMKGVALLSSTSVQLHEGDDIYVPYNTATIPVQRNNWYTAEFMQTSGSPDLTLLWVPLLPA